MIKLIVFDLWQTLAYRKGDYHHRATYKMLKETRANIPMKNFVKVFEKSVQRKRWKSKFEAYKNLCRNMGVETTKHNVNLLLNIRDKAEAQTTLYAHTIPMLKQLRKQGYKSGLISNTSVFAIDQIKKKTNLLEYIDYPIFSYKAGVIKPDLRSFKEVLRLSKCKPKEAIMVGDSLNDDVLPPKRIGMNAIHFRDYAQLRKALSSFNININ